MCQTLTAGRCVYTLPLKMALGLKHITLK